MAAEKSCWSITQEEVDNSLTIVPENRGGNAGEVQSRGRRRRVRMKDVVSRWDGASSKALRDIGPAGEMV